MTRLRGNPTTNLVSKVLSFPCMNHAFRLEVVEVVEVEVLVLASEFLGSLLASRNDGVDIFINQGTGARRMLEKKGSFLQG